MSKAMKIWFIIATSLVLIGAIVFVGVMTMLKWDFTKLSTNKYETNTYTLSEDFKDIIINTDTADVCFLPSEDLKCSVVCYEQNNATHSVLVNNEKLSIEITDTRKWYEYISINFQKPKITVFLPKTEYSLLELEGSTGNIEISDNFVFENIDVSVSTGEVKCFASVAKDIRILASTGDIYVEKISAGTLDISVSTGRVMLSDIACDGDISVNVSTGDTNMINVTCKNAISDGSTGDMLLKNVIASEKFSFERSTGDINFEYSDAGGIFIKTDTGDVEGTFLTEKVFVTKTDTGKIRVPNSAMGGRCEITTDTGDIIISTKQ